MAEKIFKEQFCEIQKIKVCTTSAELNFDNYTTAGTYEIYEDMGSNRSRVYFLTVDKSASGACVTQTRVYCGKVEERHTNTNGTWTSWTATTGGSGGYETWTDEDKQAIVNDVLAALPNGDGVNY